MKAALYVRSSKDAHDISLAAQKHELGKLAASRSLTVVKSFEDAVQSGSTENRPGFIELVRALKDPQRGWTYLLVYDTSRIARRRYIAQAIKHEAKKRGVTILYARLPADLDPVAELVLESVFEAMDEAHSLMSREKGLAGMAQNVRQGWRAGGRAPIGYRLETHTTGAVRDGKPVTKSKLILGPRAREIGAYLKARAAGVPRTIAMRVVEDMQPSSLVGVEWNALTYAGHTVWNRHAAEGAGMKRRSRSEWHITRDTHDALITEAEAETIISQLETSNVGQAVSRAKAAMSPHLLTGLLCTSDGQMWVGHGRYYRLKRQGMQRGKLVRSDLVDQAVLQQIDADMRSDLFLRNLLAAAKRTRDAIDPAAAIDRRVHQLEKEKARAAELALAEESTFMPMVVTKAREIEALQREAAAVRADGALSRQLSSLTVERLRELLADQGPVKAIQTLVERIVLEPDLRCQIELKAVPGRQRWRSVASPKESHTWPHELIQEVKLRRA